MNKLKYFFYKFWNNLLFRNGVIVFVASFIGGVGSYFFNLAMSRMLGPVVFGSLASLVALLAIISVPASTIRIIVSRHVAQLKAHGEIEQIHHFIDTLNRRFLVIGSISFVFFIVLSPIITNFLHLSSKIPVIILGCILVFSLISPINDAALQGMQKFVHSSVGTVMSALSKVSFGIFLIWLHWGLNGALTALAIATIIEACIYYFSLGLPKNDIAKNKLGIKITSSIKLVFITNLCIAIFFNIDIVLVKHFLPAVTTGHYSVLMLLGKIIFFITGVFPIIMFPMIVDRHARNQKYSHLVKYTFLAVLSIALLITGSYFLIPKLIVQTLFGTTYLSIVPYLGWIGIFMTFISIIYLLVMYNLSIQQTNFIPILVIGVIIEPLLICFFHQNIGQIIFIITLVAGNVLFGLLTLEIRNSKKLCISKNL